MENNYAVGLSLSFKLINTITSKSFRKSLVTLWQGAEASENIFAVNNKACNELERKIRLFERHNDISIVYNYLESLCNEHGIKVKAADKKGLIRDFTIDTYTEVSRFLRDLSSKSKPFGQMQHAQFETHELLWSLIDYLLIKDSVEKGTGHNKLDALIQKLFNTKPKAFFERGYIGDLFVADRLALHLRPKECFQIMCKRDYLSTLMVGRDQHSDQDEQYVQYKVA
jgi:hypothetical protein